MTAEFDARVRLALYRDFVSTGRAPSAARLAEALGERPEAIRESWERLAAGRAIVLQPESREILFAPPLAAVPTPYVARSGGRTYFAACAWDAFGAAAMLGGDAVIETSCACCGEAMRGAADAIGGVVHFSVPARQWWTDLVFT
jgi:hypothetical protein